MKKFMKNLTPNKRLVITFVLSNIIAILFMMSYSLCKTNPFSEIAMISSSLIIIYFGPFWLIRKRILTNTQAKETAISYLSKDKFTQLAFIEPYNETKIFSVVLIREGYRFFAKLKDDDNILLIVKNKEDDKVVYSFTISNHSYFLQRFKTI